MLPTLKICSLCRQPIAHWEAYHRTDKGRRYHTGNSTPDPQDPEDDSMRMNCHRWMLLYKEVERQVAEGD